MANKGSKSLQLLLTPAVILALGVIAYFIWHSRPGYEIEPGYLTVEEAYMSHASGIMAEVTGRVVRILRDDRDGVHHQRFMVRLPNGQTIMVIHSVDRSDRVPVRLEDSVLVRGEYDWDESGGAISWTHKDSSARRRHGWIEYKGHKYD